MSYRRCDFGSVVLVMLIMVAALDLLLMQRTWLTRRTIVPQNSAARITPMSQIAFSLPGDVNEQDRSTTMIYRNQKRYNIGTKIEVEIFLRTGNGQNRTRGGDQLRVRTFDASKKAFAPGHVTDHNNGSYTAVVPVLWSGRQTISVFLAYRREAVRAIYHIRREIPGTRTIAAIFINGSQREDTECHPERRWLRQYPYVCNLTRDNGDMSWYCRKPRSKEISCQDWSYTKYVTPFPELPLTKVEEDILRQSWEEFPDIEVEVEGGKQERNDQPSCSMYPRHLLWKRTEPTGYFYNDKWYLLHCQPPTTSVYRPCVQGKHLMISGDSTTRQWYEFLKTITQCTQITEKWTHEKWHRKSICVAPSLNFTLEWLPHAQPFLPADEWDSHKYGIHSVASNINAIGNTSNVIFVIHMFMHMTAFHHSIFRDRMRIISKSVRNLLKINKNVTFMIKAPHTYKIKDTRGNRLDDYFGYAYKDIMLEEFEGLRDKIVFMDQKDMTIAKALTENHPPVGVVKEAVFQMFNYLC